MIKNTNKAHINDRFIKSLKAPAKGSKIYYDDKLIGFGVRITAKGFISFLLRYVINRRERKYTIGRYPDFTSTSARERITSLKGQITKGIDPLEKRNNSRKVITMKVLIEQYIENYAKVKKRPSSVRDDLSMIKNNILPKLGKRKIDTITKKDMILLHNSLKSTPYRANRTLTLLSTIFNLAIDWDILKINPAKNIKKYPEHKRERWLSELEIMRFNKALNEHPNQRNAFIVKLLLLTGARRTEVLSARWEQFDFNRNVWIKPASSTKQKGIHKAPLNDEAIKILNDVKNYNEKMAKEDIKKSGQIKSGYETSGYLFYNPQTNSYIKDIKFFWKDICKRANLQNARIHDLRHTYASYLVSSGFSLSIVGSLMGHSDTKTTQRYAHLADKALRETTNEFGKIYKGLNKKQKFK